MRALPILTFMIFPLGLLASTGVLADSDAPSPSTVPAANSANTPAQSNTLAVPYGDSIDALKKAGFTDADLSAWKGFATAAYCHTEEITKDDGSTANEMQCNVDTEELTQWKSTGLSPDDAEFWGRNGLSPDGAKLVNPIFKRTCKGKLAADLGHQNPYSTKSKCFLITGYATLQLIDAHNALASPSVSLSELGGLGALAQAAGASDPKNILVNYGAKKYAPAENAPVTALVIGTGAWQYNSAEGTLETVAKVNVLVDLSQEN